MDDHIRSLVKHPPCLTLCLPHDLHEQQICNHPAAWPAFEELHVSYCYGVRLRTGRGGCCIRPGLVTGFRQ